MTEMILWGLYERIVALFCAHGIVKYHHVISSYIECKYKRMQVSNLKIDVVNACQHTLYRKLKNGSTS